MAAISKFGAAVESGSPGKNSADNIFDRHFLNINVADRQLIQQRLANSDDAVAFELIHLCLNRCDVTGSLLHVGEDFIEFAVRVGSTRRHDCR